MTIQDAIKVMREARSRVVIVFRYSYMGGYRIEIQICNEKLKEATDASNKRNIKSHAILYFGVLADPDLREIANAISELHHPVTLVLIGFALIEFGIDGLVNLINKARHSVTLIIAGIKLRYNNIVTISKVITEARCPITLKLKSARLGSASITILADAIKKARVPVTLDVLQSMVGIVVPFMEILKKAQVPVNIKLYTTNRSIYRAYRNMIHGNFAVEARVNPSAFLERLECSVVSLMLNATIQVCPKELIGLIKSYISNTDLACLEMLAIRSVEGASYDNKYSSINNTALMLKYSPQYQVDNKEQGMECKHSSSMDIDDKVIVHKLLLNFLARLYSNSKNVSAGGFEGHEALIRYLTLMPSVPSMTIPDGFVNVPGDGLCFYHAVAQQLGYTDGPALQREAVNEILTHYPRYQGFLEESFWDENLEGPGKDNRGWAGHVMIRAVASMLHRPIEIRRFGLDGVENQDKVVILPYEFDPVLQELRLGNIANLHFVASATTAGQSGTDGGVAGNQEPSGISSAITGSHEDL